MYLPPGLPHLTLGRQQKLSGTIYREIRRRGWRGGLGQGELYFLGSSSQHTLAGKVMLQP